MNETTVCPCGSRKALNDCCGPIIAGEALAETAEALMRSRFTAYALGELDHIDRSNAEETKPDFNRAEAERVAQDCDFQRLEITSASEDGDRATVEFAFRFRHNGAEKIQRERSRFRREDGVWYYVDSDVNPKQEPARRENRIGRNDPCPCGSGKKYKKCCGLAA